MESLINDPAKLNNSIRGVNLVCPVCKKEFEKKRYNSKYCSKDCADEFVFIKNKSPCEICGFDLITERHHIIKRQDYGSDNEENCVYLCPNHHKMADSIRYGDEMRQNILEKTGKAGKKLSENQIKAIEDEIARRVGGYEYKSYYCWHSTKIMLISGGIFYQLIRGIE